MDGESSFPMMSVELAAMGRRVARDFAFQWRSEHDLEELTTSLLSNPDDLVALKRCGDLLESLGRPSEALTSRQRLAELMPGDAAVWNQLAWACFGLDLYDRAAEAAAKAAEIEPEVVDHQGVLALSLAGLGRGDEARAVVEELIERAADQPPAWLALANVEALLGQEIDIVDRLLAWTQRTPDNPAIWQALAFAAHMGERGDVRLTACKVRTQLRPGDADAWNELGEALTDLEEHQQALEADRQAIELDPLKAVYHANAGFDLVNLGLLDQALAEYAKATELDPAGLAGWVQLATTLERSGKADEALAVRRKLATELDSGSPESWFAYASALGAAAEAELSATALDNAVALEPDNPGIRFTRAIIHLGLGQNDEGLKALREATAVDEHNPAVWRLYAHICLPIGRAEDALAALAKVATQLLPDDVDAWIEYAEALGDNGLDEEALTALDTAAELAPDIVDVWKARIQPYTRLGRAEDALTAQRRLTELDAENPVVWSAYAHALVALGKYEEALAADRKAAELDAGSSLHHRNIGADLRALGRHDEAVTAYLRAAEVEPADQNNWHMLAAAHEQLGHQAQALAALAKVAEEVAPGARAWIDYAQALRRFGRGDEALSALEKATRLDADALEAWGFIAELKTDLRRFDEALAAYDHMQRIAPEDPWVVARRLAGLYRAGFVAEAESYLESKLDAAVSGEAAAFGEQLSAKLLQAGSTATDRALGLAIAKWATRADPLSGLAADELARQLAIAGDLPGAAQVVEEALGRIPGDRSLRRRAAWIALDQGALEKAESDFRALLDDDPGDLLAALELARILRLRYRYGEARALLTQQPDDPEFLAELGSLSTEQGDIAGAVEAYQRLTEREPDNVEHWRLLIEALRLRPDAAGAMAALERAEQATNDRGRAELDLQRGWIAFEAGDIEGATAAFRKVTVADPVNAGGWEALVYTLRISSEFGKAREAFAAAEPTFGEAQPLELVRERALLAMDEGDSEAAEAGFRRLMLADPAWIELISYLRLQRKTPQARAELEQIPQWVRDQPSVMVEEGWIAFDEGDLDAAARMFERVTSVAGSLQDGWPGLVCTWRAKGEFDKAAEAFKKGMATLDADGTQARANLVIEGGWLEFDRGQYAEALRLWNGLLGTAFAPDVYPAIIRCLRVQRDFEAAQEALAKAKLVSPVPTQELRAEQAWLVFELGDYPAAAQEFGELVKLQPFHAETRLGLAMSLRYRSTFDEAQAALEAAFQTPMRDEPMLVLERGWVDYDRGDYPGAERWFRKVHDRKRGDLDAALAVADALRGQRRFPEAAEILADWSSDKRPWVQVALGLLAKDQGDLGRAHKIFAALTNERPDHVRAWTLTAQVLRQMREFTKAGAVLAEARSRFADRQPWLRIEQGWCLFDSRDLEGAYQLFCEEVQGPATLTAAAASIEVLREMGRLTDARGRLGLMLEEHGDASELLVERAELAYLEGAYKEALADFEEASLRLPARTDAAKRQIGCLRHLDRLDDAVERGRQLYEQNSHNLDLAIELGLAYTARRGDGDADEAVKLAETVRAADPGNRQLPQVARILREAGKIARAEEHIRAAIRDERRRGASTPQLYRELGAICLSQRNVGAAIVELHKCLSLDRFDQTALRWLTDILWWESRWTEVHKVLADHEDVVQENRHVLIIRGDLRLREWQFAGAMSDYKRARSISPDDSPERLDALIGESKCLLELDRGLEAEALLRAELTKYKGRKPFVDSEAGAESRLTSELAYSLQQQGLVREAMDLLEAAFGAKGVRRAGQRGADILIGLRQYDKAEGILSELAAGNDAAMKLRYARFLLQYHGSTYTKSVTSLIGTAETLCGPNNPDVYGCRGILAEQSGDLRAAESRFRRALELDAFSPWRSYLVNVLIRCARYDEAEQELDKMLKTQPRSADAITQQGVLRYEQQQFREAEVGFRQALAADALHVGAICGLAAALLAQGKASAAEYELRRAVNSLSAKEDDLVRLRLAVVLIKRGDETKDETYYQQAVTEARSVLDNPDSYFWGLSKEDVLAEARYLLGMASYKLAEASAEPWATSHYQKEAFKSLSALRRMDWLKYGPRYPDVDRLRDSLRQRSRRASSTQTPGYIIATVSIGLVLVLWYQYIVRKEAQAAFVGTLTPILLGIAAVAMLYPILASLKLPGFEASIRQPELHQLLPSRDIMSRLAMAVPVGNIDKLLASYHPSSRLQGDGSSDYPSGRLPGVGTSMHEKLADSQQAPIPGNASHGSGNKGASGYSEEELTREVPRR